MSDTNPTGSPVPTPPGDGTTRTTRTTTSTTTTKPAKPKSSRQLLIEAGKAAERELKSTDRLVTKSQEEGTHIARGAASAMHQHGKQHAKLLRKQKEKAQIEQTVQLLTTGAAPAAAPSSQTTATVVDTTTAVAPAPADEPVVEAVPATVAPAPAATVTTTTVNDDTTTEVTETTTNPSRVDELNVGTEVTTTRRGFNPNPFSGAWSLLEIVGGIIGFCVALWLVTMADPDLNFDFISFIELIVIIAILLAGFFGGAWLVWLVGDVLAERRARPRTERTTVRHERQH